MEPKIVSRDAFAVMGTLTRVTRENENKETYGAIWNDFEAHQDQIKPHSIDQAYYGVSFTTGEVGATNYLAGMAVKDSVTIPEGLVIREVPSSRYAVFECPVQSIGETYGYIFNKWLPSSPYEMNSSAPAFEQYPPEGEEESPVLIHIPVKQK